MSIHCTNSQFFNSVYIKEDASNIPEFATRSCNEINSLSDDLLSHLNTSKAMGPDKIHAWVLKEGRHGLRKPLSMLYNLSLKSGKFPSDWKQALVTPIFKKGSRYDPKNYRPVSLTSEVCKILESFVSSSISEFLTHSTV